MAAQRDVIVVGAGLVGSLLALTLAKRGHRVRIFERRPDMRRTDISAGKSINLALSDRGLKALDAAGAGADVRRDALPMHGRLIHDEAGATNFQPYGERGQFINSVSRGGLNCTLMDLAEELGKVDITFEAPCVDVAFGGPSEQPALTFEIGGKRQRVEADFVFGADGAFSAVRMAMLITERFNYSIDWLEHGYKELSIPPGADGGYRIREDTLHIWPRGTYMLIALPNPDGSFTCTLFLPFERDGDEPSFASLQTDDDVRAFFGATFADAVDLMPTLVEDFRANPTGSLGTVRCAPWQQQGRVCLIGDAAHAIVPFYGQGMNAGFEDVSVLSALLDEEDEDFGRAMLRFSKERKADGDAIADLAVYNFLEMRDRVADERFVLQKQIERKISDLYGERYEPLYSMVTFSHRPYSEAQAYGAAQEELMAGILSVEGIAEKWDTAAFEPELRRRVDSFLRARE